MEIKDSLRLNLWTVRVALFTGVAILWPWLGSGSGLAFNGFDNLTLGMQILRRTPNSQLTSEGGTALYDGRIKTSPPDGQHMDRRSVTFLRVGADVAMNPAYLLVTVQGTTTLRTEEDDLQPKIYIDERTVSGKATADGLFQLQNNLEVFGGAVGYVHPGYMRITSTSNGKSKRKYNSGMGTSFRGGLGKRSGEWTAGIYLQSKSEISRDYEEDVFDGSSTSGADMVYSPQRIGVFGGTGFAGGTHLDGEFDVVQASGGGPKDAGGRTVNDDHFAAQGSFEFPLYSGTRGRAGFSHQTISYSDQAFMSLDNIPGTALRLEGLVSEGNVKMAAGLVYGLGNDTQSLPEFNASYSYRAYGLIGSLRVAL